MPEIIFGDNQTPQTSNEEVVTNIEIHNSPVSFQRAETVVPENQNVNNKGIETSNIHGLSEEERNYPNKISVEIEDKSTPIVVFFGPPSSGKTMTLIRLARYLNSKNYIISPVRSFRPADDTLYEELCDKFNDMVTDENAAPHTDLISFMLVKVLKNGKPLCQILEAPGEGYFDPKNPDIEFPKYFNTIKNVENRKFWAIIIEPNWENRKDRDNYVSRIKKLKTSMRPKDKVCFVYNKIDKTGFVREHGNVKMDSAKKSVQDSYSGIFESFKNEIPIIKWIVPYRCDLIPFQTGDYNKLDRGGQSYTPGPDEYPKLLWETIEKRIIKG